MIDKFDKVKVFCPICKGGDNTIWEGNLKDWSNQLSNSDSPNWFLYAKNHEKAHPGHKIMVEYFFGIVPLIGE